MSPQPGQCVLPQTQAAVRRARPRCRGRGRQPHSILLLSLPPDQSGCKDFHHDSQAVPSQPRPAPIQKTHEAERKDRSRYPTGLGPSQGEHLLVQARTSHAAFAKLLQLRVLTSKSALSRKKLKSANSWLPLPLVLCLLLLTILTTKSHKYSEKKFLLSPMT